MIYYLELESYFFHILVKLDGCFYKIVHHKNHKQKNMVYLNSKICGVILDFIMNFNLHF